MYKQLPLYERVALGLDDDQRILFPEHYTQDVYDKICGVAYLVRGRHENSPLDWVWETGLQRLVSAGEVEILKKVYIVRIRLPWNEVPHEWMLSKEEFLSQYEDLEVLDMFFLVSCADGTKKMAKYADILEDPSLKILEQKYLVTWKSGGPDIGEQL